MEAQAIDTFASINDFADLVKVPARTIRRMVKEGKLPVMHRGECHVLIPVAAGSKRLVELSMEAMNEKREFVAAVSPVVHWVDPPQRKSGKHRGRMPDSIRLGREAK